MERAYWYERVTIADSAQPLREHCLFMGNKINREGPQLVDSPERALDVTPRPCDQSPGLQPDEPPTQNSLSIGS